MPNHFEVQEAYIHVHGRVQGKVVPIPGIDEEDLDNRAIIILSTALRFVGHFKLAGRPEQEIEEIIELAWDVFKSHCENESPWTFADALLEKCIEDALRLRSAGA